jgi:aminoglycoside 3-N-acetyltransferase
METHISHSMISAGLQELGLPAGAHVLVHSSLSSFGYVAGGADTLIDALLDVVGPQGTLLVPTLTGSEELSPANPPFFDPQETPAWTGRVPETLRRRAGAIRSLHPTHSVAAIGALADALTRDHALSVTPCDECSPYGQLAQREDGYILLLGVTHESNTTLHHVEELAGAAYHMQPEFAAARIRVNGETQIRHIMLHSYDGPERNFAVLEPLLIERGVQRNGCIGRAEVRLIRAQGLVRIALAVLRANPRILCRAEL